MIAINQNEEAVPLMYILTDYDLRGGLDTGTKITDFRLSQQVINTMPTLVYINKDGKAVLLKSRHDNISIGFIDLRDI
jgi:hypothetical protein